ncbi:hypothetical protein Poli38472_006964 [Pythium oligandrum]|uniref:RWP-RK domain-containing protein n=1 Tax=Pythium oligandrum TaxID=41045 RepID=A0A8K1C997_PYTOL|nr:hypothetical protein Poli38472_006964 [Pythium oligandrum]|eukprot:TMW58819.1 hypothetical protein Poli38472_006964 [Pythium oligandrum]
MSPIECFMSSPVKPSIKRREEPRMGVRVGRVLKLSGKKSRKQRKSRVLYHYTKEELEPFFHISQKEAAKRLGIAVITLKRICKREKFNWPFRANKTKIMEKRRQKRSNYKTRRKQAKPQVASSPCEEWDSCPSEEWHSSPSREWYPQSSEWDDANKFESYEDQLHDALNSLALCAFQMEEQANVTMSAAALAFSRLPHVCMSENN